MALAPRRLQRMELRMTLLAGGREVAPHLAEVPRPGLAPEATPDLLLHLHPPQITLRPVIGEGH